MTALLTDNLPLLAGAPNGIKKLRELILELAVRGKLVPQDPNDEPASELLKRIAEEKARLVAEGKIKKTKALPEVSEEEQFFELPIGWTWCRLQDAFDVRDGTHDTPKYQPSGYPLVTSKNLYTGKLDLTDVKFISEEDHQKISARSKVDRGDILFAMIGSIGNPAIVDTDIPFSIKNVALLKQYAPGQISTDFLLLYLWVAAADMREKSAGGVQSFVSLGSIRLYPFAFPALSEQHRIVAKVDELMALCDRLEAQQADAESAHVQLVHALLDSLTQTSNATDFAANWQRLAEHFHTLFTTEPSIEALKQTLLQLAVMGKLVQQDPSDEPANELLKGIQSSRADKRKIVMLAEDAPVVERLPESWAWSSIDQLSADDPRAITDGPFGANLKTEHYIDAPGFRVVRLQNIGNGEFRDEHRAYISQDQFEKITKHQVLSGDLLIAGLIDTSIRCCSVPENIGPAVVKADCYRFSVHPLLSPKYALYYLNSKMAHEFAAIHHHGLTLTRIGLGNFRSIPVPLPPTAEQNRIVAKVDQLMALCDLLKTRLIQARQLNEQLASTLVEQAVA